MSIRFDERVVIVTGAGHGLGRSHALEFARRGARVVVNDLGSARDGSGASSDAASEVVRQINAAGGEAVANGANVARFEQVEAMVEETLDRWGRIDVLVNNAGIMPLSLMSSLKLDEWDRMVDVNIKGVLYGIAAWIGPERLHNFIVKYGKWFRITNEDIERAERWFDRRAIVAVLVGRCVPLIRSLVSVPAGFRRMPLVPFLVYTVIGSLVWNTGLITAGYVLGEEDRWKTIEDVMGYVQYVVVAAILGAILALKEGEPDVPVVFVSKDINLRIKDALHLPERAGGSTAPPRHGGGHHRPVGGHHHPAGADRAHRHPELTPGSPGRDGATARFAMSSVMSRGVTAQRAGGCRPRISRVSLHSVRWDDRMPRNPLRRCVAAAPRGLEPVPSP